MIVRLVPSMIDLKKRIGEHRNEVIDHVSELNIAHATTWGPHTKSKILVVKFHPDNGEKSQLNNRSSEDLDELLRVIDQYIVAMLSFFEVNKSPRPKPRT